MSWNAMLDRFAEEAPVATMVRGLMANTIARTIIVRVRRSDELNPVFKGRVDEA
jgi:hypothetical protein